MIGAGLVSVARGSMEERQVVSSSYSGYSARSRLADFAGGPGCPEEAGGGPRSPSPAAARFTKNVTESLSQFERFSLYGQHLQAVLDLVLEPGLSCQTAREIVVAGQTADFSIVQLGPIGIVGWVDPVIAA
jgi:hypothetical protein